MNKYARVTLITALTVCADQATKYLIATQLDLYRRITLVPDILNIVHVRNTGVAFGLFRNSGGEYRLALLIGGTLLSLCLLGYLLRQTPAGRRLEAAALALVMGGAIGNLIDRLRIGEVIDFIDLHWRNLYHWPAFNVADSAITVGITLYLVCEFFLDRRKPH